MKLLISYFIAILLTTGCSAIIREEFLSGSSYPTLSHNYDQSVLVDIDLNHEKIIGDSSFIIDPKGNKYGIIVKPHQYDIRRNHSTVRVAVYPIQKNGAFLRNWPNGVWTFHLMLESEGKYREIEQKKKYWVVYYPIFFPPN